MATEEMLKHLVPAEHLKCLGDIIVSFAMLESQIQSLIGSLLRDHQRIHQIITAELSFKNMRALATSLFIERNGSDDEDYVNLKKLMIHAGQVEEKRNQILHSIWAAGRNKDTITRMKTTAKEKNGIKFHFEDVSANDLEQFSTEIKTLAHDVLSYVFLLIDKGKAISSPIEQQWP